MSTDIDKQQILEKYQGKILAIRNYKSEQKEFLVNDFTNVEALERILEEIDTGESDITPAGKKFLEDYYGLDNLFKVLEKSSFLSSSEKLTKERLSSWLGNLEPMGTMKFIEESRGNLKGDESLREDLLPPEN